MRTVLVPIDGSRHGERAVSEALLRAHREPAEIQLLNVQPRISSYAACFLDAESIRAFREDAADRELAGARDILERAEAPFAVHLHVGEPARTIAEAARDLRSAEIVMSAGDSLSFGDVAQRLLVARVIRLADVSVVVVKGSVRRAPVLRPSLGWRRLGYLR